MVIFYNISSKEIIYTENKVMYPTLPDGTIELKLEELSKQGLAFVAIPYEMGLEVFNLKVGINAKGEFIGLQPK